MKTQQCKKNNCFILYPHHQGLSHPFLGKEIHLLLLHLNAKQQNIVNRWASATLRYCNACVPGLHTICKQRKIYMQGVDQGAGSLITEKKMVLRAKNVCLPHLFSRKRKREPSFKLRLLKPELSLRWHNYFVKKKRKTYFQGILHLNFPLKHLAQRVAYLPVNTKIMITNYETLR